MMIPDEEFEKRGYSKTKSSSNAFNHSDHLCQKRVRDQDGKTLYFINVWQYLPLPERDYHGGSMVEATFYESEDRDAPWYTIKMNNPRSVSDIEAFYRFAYCNLDFIPDIFNQD